LRQEAQLKTPGAGARGEKESKQYGHSKLILTMEHQNKALSGSQVLEKGAINTP